MDYDDLGYAKVDLKREKIKGFPEVVYCEGKTPEQCAGIARSMMDAGFVNVLFTRASREVYDAVAAIDPGCEYDGLARTIVLCPKEGKLTGGTILVVCAGTSDLPVAREALVTAKAMGNRTELLCDVGVAGLHRLLSNVDMLRSASVIIVVAGMEGALPSVVGGLTDKPVIAVPTSVGYGASFGGVAALLGMLNSCASGVTVVNIDNGFGAAYAASLINRLAKDDK